MFKTISSTPVQELLNSKALVTQNYVDQVPTDGFTTQAVDSQTDTVKQTEGRQRRMNFSHAESHGSNLDQVDWKMNHLE